MRNNREKLTQEYLKECLSYNPLTGIFIWNVRPISHFKNSKGMNIANAKFSNRICGDCDKYGYINIGINGVKYKAHRLAFLYMEGYLPENDVDHIDRNVENNKWDNLREVSHRCNLQNCCISKNNTSGVTGVYWNKTYNKWVSEIKIGYIKISLDSFVNFQEAVMARYREEVRNPLWTCSVDSSAYLYLKEHNII